MKNSIIKNLRLAFALALVLMFSGMSFATNGKLSGSGTQASPYKISDAADLKAFAKLVNDGIQTDAWAELTANIDMNFGKTVLNHLGRYYNDDKNLDEWTPIGVGDNNNFKGHFDGLNHTIRGLYYENDVSDFTGLFAVVGEQGVVQNVGVIDSYFYGLQEVGGVVGHNEGSISNVYNTGSVGGLICVGGVVGHNEGFISDVYNTGFVEGGDCAGGVVGKNTSNGVIYNAYNKGLMEGYGVYNKGLVEGFGRVGGVVGDNEGSISNVYSTGKVYGYNDVGGVVGYNEGSVTDGYYSIFKCSSCGGAINGVDDVKNNVVGLTNEEFADKKLAYYIAFLDSDGKNILQQGFVQPNEVPIAPKVRDDDDYYTYTEKWTPEIVAANKNATYQLVIDSSLKRLDVTVEMYDGSPIILSTESECVTANVKNLKSGFITIKNPSTADLSATVESYTLKFSLSLDEESEKCADDPYVKAFKASTEDIAVYVNGEKISYVANKEYDASSNCGLYEGNAVYLITFLDSDGETVLKKSGVAPDAMPVPPAIPTVDDETYHYVVGWDKEIVAATENATYTLVKTSIPWATAGLLGSGTEADPYLIGNAQALRDFAAKVNSGEETSAWAVLKVDIDLNPGKKVLNDDGTLYNEGKDLEEWTPIGQIGSPYVGIFDGKGHVVSGLYFNKDADDYVGLFGFISGSETKVQKVGVVDSYFNGRQYVGGVVGYNEAGYVNYVYHTGSVNGNTSVGGVVGCNRISNEGIVQDVYGVGSVKGTSNVGGVVGSNQAKVSRGYYSTSSCPSCGGAINGVDDTTKNVIGKTSEELLDGSSLSFVFGTWILGAKGENPKQDTLYYPYLKVFGPGPYVLGAVKKYTISVAVNDKKKGSVTGAGEYEYGTEIELSATAKEGYKFSNWQDDVKDAKRKITVTGDKTYTAKFEKLPESSSSKNSDNDEKSDSKEKSSSSSSKEKSGKKIGIVAAAQVQQFHVAVSGKMLSVAGIRPNTSVEVFDMQGNKVKSVVATSANAAFILSDAGVYVVKNGNFVSRVNIR